MHMKDGDFWQKVFSGQASHGSFMSVQVQSGFIKVPSGHSSIGGQSCCHSGFGMMVPVIDNL